MPSRALTLGIIVLWLATVAWMIFRDFVPVWTATEPPTFLIDLDDEVAAKEIFWTVYSEGRKAGIAKTEVRFLDKGKYQFLGEMLLHDINIIGNENTFGVEMKRVTSSFHMNHEGRIQEINAKVFLASPQLSEITIEVQGVVVNQVLHPKLTVAGQPIDPYLPDLKKPVPLSDQGSIMNITHPLNKIRNLAEGKRWRIPVLNPVPSLVPGKGISFLFAEVFSDKLNWNGQDLDCWRIDFTDHDTHQRNLRIWVRQDNSVVLQHEAKYAHLEIIMKRAG
jgi:hypothetical protein